MKRVLINSTGPMGSSIVAAIVEKFGYLNIPIRDMGLHDYLLDENNVDMDMLKAEFYRCFEVFSEKVSFGGVNIFDRDTSEPRYILDSEKIHDGIRRFDTNEYTQVVDCYNGLRGVFAEALKYKKSYHVTGKHVELTTDFCKYDTSKLIASYNKEFGSVALIHLHRDFIGWVESLASQRFVNPSKRYLFVLRWEYSRYVAYEKSMKNLPGLHLNFNSLFDLSIKHLAKDISLEIDEVIPDIQWEKEKYDLYGNLRDFESTFTKADFSGKYFSKATRYLIAYFIRGKKITKFHDVIVYFFYLFDLGRYLIKESFPFGRER